MTTRDVDRRGDSEIYGAGNLFPLNGLAGNMTSLEPDGEILASNIYDNSTAGQMSTTVLETLGELIGIDPATTDFHLDDVIKLENIDRLGRSDSNDDQLEIAFRWGGYRVCIFASGLIEVWGDCRKYQESPRSLLPASMRISARSGLKSPQPDEITGEIGESENGSSE